VIARRNLLAAMGASSLLARLPAFAQSGRIWRIGFVFGRDRQELVGTGRHDAFMQGLREQGYVEGRNVVMEFRFAEGRLERLAGLVDELVRLPVDVIVSTGTQISFAAQKATSTIPIVITAEADPVRSGFAASLARPGRNLTGFSTSTGDLVQKHPELIKLAAPRTARIAVLRNTGNAGHTAMVATVQAAAARLGMHAFEVKAQTAPEIEQAFATMRRERADALIGLIDAFFVQQRVQLAELAIRNRLPSIYAQVEHADAGGLMVYGQDQIVNYRRAAIFIDKIFKGAKPGELPFEQPTKLDLILNNATARAISLTFPQELVLRADKVIE